MNDIVPLKPRLGGQGGRPGSTVCRLTAAATLLLALAIASAGCATYTDHMQEAHLAGSRGNYHQAVRNVNRVLGVKSDAEMPAKWDGTTGLALLERAVLLQAIGQYDHSARDFRAADEKLELLDLSADPVGRLARFLYSDAATTYRIRPAEQLALNPMNMLNYLAMDNLQAAAVEARRFGVMRNYLHQTQRQQHDQRFGSYLAGYVFERLGEAEQALRHYDDALAAGAEMRTLVWPVHRLARQTGWRGANIQRLLDAHPDAGRQLPDPDYAEVLIVISLGRVPHRVPERIPAGLAIALAGTFFTGNPDWLTRGAAKVVVYPELAGRPQISAAPALRIGDTPLGAEMLTDLDRQVRTEHEQVKPMILAAALTRLLARAGVAEGVRASIGGDDALGALAGLLTELALMGLDTPDTRSWTFLPARIMVARAEVTPGDHNISVTIPGVETRNHRLTLNPNDSQVIVVTSPR